MGIIKIKTLLKDIKRVYLLHLYMGRIEKYISKVDPVPYCITYKGKHWDILEDAARKLSRQYPYHSFRFYAGKNVSIYVKYAPREQRGFYKELVP